VTRKMNYTLWTVQWILALLYLFSGSVKLIMPAAELTKLMTLPVLFIRFIGVAELFGAAGLVLPGLLRIRQELTPMAAGGLAVIMVGATVLTVQSMGAVPAIMPFVVGLLVAFVALGRLGALQQMRRKLCLSPSQS